MVLEKIEPPFVLIKPKVSFDEYMEIADEDIKVELVGGDLIMHSPASFKHERIFGFLFFLMKGYVSSKGLGEVLGSRFSVRLTDEYVFEPDILFVSKEKPNLIKNMYLDGSPDLVVEILSETTKKYDLGVKLEKYFEFGVKEYWVIEPDEQWFRLYTKKSDFIEMKKGKVKSDVVEGFWINVVWFWELPPATECLEKIIKRKKV